MSLQSEISALAVRIATEFKTILTKITGNASGSLAGLTTTTKTSLLAAINELVSSKQASLGFSPENTANKGAASGYVPLGSDSKIAATYLPASSGLTLGETDSTAYRGDRGKTAYDHSQAAHAPTTAQKNSDITKAEIEAKLTGSITTHTHASVATLTTGRTIGITGDVTYTSPLFNGSANVTGEATLANSGATAGTYKSVTVDVKGRVTGGTNPTTIAGYGITDVFSKTEIGDITTDFVTAFEAALL